jgi:hypothetical protein
LASEAVIGLVCIRPDAKEDSTMYFSVADYIRLGKVDFAYSPTLNVIRSYQRRYKHGIPVPAAKLQYIPAPGRKNWNNASGNRWDRFLRDFYPSSSLS